jgi:hypothetical protein
MKTLSIRLSGIALLISAASVLAGPPVVNPEPMDMDADISAKIGKEKSKRNMAVGGMKNKSSSDDGKNGCGNVVINSSENKSNSGIKDMFGKQSTTIVTGPVINMANCK